MQDQYTREQFLIGAEAVKTLKKAHVAVFGLGGVGSYCVEALARSGIGAFTVFDGDCISVTNINRQLFALHSTIGRYKAELAKERILSINPEASVTAHALYYTAQNQEQFDFKQFSYIIDAIDMVSSKILLIENAKQNAVPIISCMGMGNKLDPTQIQVDDIYRTSVCPLARVMRREMKKRKIDFLDVVYSKELPHIPYANENIEQGTTKPVPGSISFVPPVAGMVLAGEAIKHMIGIA